MSCPRELLYDRVYGLLEGEEAERVDTHLAACASCRAEDAALRRRDKVLDVWRPGRRRRFPLPALAAAFLASAALSFSWPSRPERGPFRADPGSEVRVLGPREIELVRGGVEVEIHGPFRVKARHTVVEVKGTKFSVREWATSGAILVTVAAGTVLVDGQPLGPGQAAISTPDGVELVRADALDALRKTRDELAAALMKSPTTPPAPPEAVQPKTFEDCLAILEKAAAEGAAPTDAIIQPMRRLVGDDAAAAKLMARIRTTRDSRLATLLAHCLPGFSPKATAAHADSIVDLLCDATAGVEIRRAYAFVFHYTLWESALGPEAAARLLRAARVEDVVLGTSLARTGAKRAAIGTPAWTELRAWLEGETNEDARREVARAYLSGGATRERPGPELDAFLAEAVGGRFGGELSKEVLSAPLIAYSRGEPALVKALGQAGGRAAAAQLAAFHLIHGAPEPLAELRAMKDPAIAEVVEGLEKRALDLDDVLRLLGVEWRF